MADQPSTATRDRVALTVILLTGLGLGLCGIDWGLPSSARVELLGDDLDAVRNRIATNPKGEGSVVIADPEQSGMDLARAYRRYFLYTHHPDEMLTLMGLAKMRPSKLDFHPHLFQYGGLFVYPVGAMLFVGSKTGLVDLKPDLGYYLRDPDQFRGLYIVGRLFVVCMYVATALLVYLFARRLCDPFPACIGAMLFLLCPGAVTFSHEMKPHAAAGFFVLLSLFWLFVWLSESKPKALWWSAAACGGAAAMVITNELFILTSLCAVWFLHGLSLRERVVKTALCCGLLAGVYFVCNPYVLLDFGSFLAEARHVRDWYTPGFSLTGAIEFVRHLLIGSFGLPGLLLAVAGFVVLWKTHRAWSAAVLAVIGLYCLLLVYQLGPLAGSSKMARLMFAIFPVLAVAAAAGLRTIPNGKLRCVTGLAVLVWMGATAYPYLSGFRADTGAQSTRLRAGDWINHNIPPGAGIAVPPSPAPYKLPSFAFGNYQLVTGIAERPDYVVMVGDPWMHPDYVLRQEFTHGRWNTPLSFASQPVRIYQRSKP